MKDNAPAALEDVIVPSFRTFRLCSVTGAGLVADMSAALGGKRIVRDG